jgi:hypothetical protein
VSQAQAMMQKKKKKEKEKKEKKMPTGSLANILFGRNVA